MQWLRYTHSLVKRLPFQIDVNNLLHFFLLVHLSLPLVWCSLKMADNRVVVADVLIDDPRENPPFAQGITAQRQPNNNGNNNNKKTTRRQKEDNTTTTQQQPESVLSATGRKKTNKLHHHHVPFQHQCPNFFRSAPTKAGSAAAAVAAVAAAATAACLWQQQGGPDQLVKISVQHRLARQYKRGQRAAGFLQRE